MDKQPSTKKTGAGYSMVTLFLKLLFLLVLIVGVPYFIITALTRYERKASGLVGQQTDLINTYSARGTNASTANQINQIKVLSTEEAVMIARINDFISGDWVSDQDGRYKLSVDPNYKFIEYYDGSKEGYGVWKISSAMKVSTISAMAANPNVEVKPEYDYFFQKEQFEPGHKGEIYKYRIDELDDEGFTMTYVEGTGHPLVFRKATSTPAVTGSSSSNI